MNKDLIYFTQYLYDYDKLIGRTKDNFLYSVEETLNSEEYLACIIAFIMGKVNSFETVEQIVSNALDSYENNEDSDKVVKDIKDIYLSGLIG